jgi:hypothetical protein
MSTHSTSNRMTQQTGDEQLIAGLTKHAGTMPSVLIGGTPRTTAEIISALQSRIAARNASVTARATWLAAVKAALDEGAATKTLVAGVRQALQVAFAGSIEALADFGLSPPKRRSLTPEEKAAATAKAKATRAARNTMGPRQKAKIKGTVPAAATSDGGSHTPPAAPAPSTTPAAAGAKTAS